MAGMSQYSLYYRRLPSDLWADESIHEVAIIRRFGKLNMLNILHLQAKLTHLEEKYYQFAEHNERNSSIAS